MSGEKTLQFRAHDEPISTCRFLQQDTLLATASHDGSVGIWNVSNGFRLCSLCGHEHRVVSMATNKSNHTLISGSWDKTVIQWDLNSQEEMWRGVHDSLVTTCHTIPEHPLVVTGCEDGSYHYWDPRTHQRVASIDAHSITITCCQLSPNCNDLCTSSMDKSSLIWDNRTHKKLLTLRDHVNVVSGCGFSHNGHYLATCSWDKTVRVYDVTAGGYRQRGPTLLSEHVGSVSACTFSRDGKLLVSCGYDRDINIWYTSDFQLKNTFRGHDDWITDIDVSDTGSQIISCGKDGVVHTWSTDTGDSYRSKRKENRGGLTLVTCSRCGRMFSPAGVVDDSHTISKKLTSSDVTTPVVEVTKTKDEAVCVFCRMQDPSRSLEQRSNQYLSAQYTQ